MATSTSTSSATSTAVIEGFAIRRNNSCLSDEVSCGSTWETWHACCPSGSYCPGSKISIPNNVCCPSWTDCTSEIEDPPVCADNSWGLYNYTGYFCCPSSDDGFMVKDTVWVGCSAPDSPGNASYSALREIVTGYEYHRFNDINVDRHIGRFKYNIRANCHELEFW
ncbi:hypothetical protein BO70DRAFT_400462 [Aspergillus heteromorphus CBS 117.55]|uniref:Uncharacterized protein n=1 Tax=Aspergillus heteromorphus CBS 117.55 TaxID=1448321 RepID=A0A317V1L9_9EURO|nr:uncharacterized protein BO70DRAFT_400462 [Aspergillus heteromorphus CBS 117.55]PWY67886.1 hypothetical protein BO70DRAFT_400462 [Aspergillus heteromorphus CBS 117.55]